MFGRKCSLCGGKLNSNNICKECGLDNTKSDKYYRINQSSCDRKPLTHVHEEKKQSAYSKRKKTEKKTEGNKKTILSFITVAIALISALGGFIGEWMSDPEPEYMVEEVWVEDPYEYLDREHPMEGDKLGYVLESGQYIVGIHIAEGNYFATMANTYDAIEIHDTENGIYTYEYMDKDGGNYLHDLRLFNGAIVTISTQSKVILETENGQTGTMESGVMNSIVDSYYLNYGEEAIAGADFEPGIYDIYVEDEWAEVYITIIDENGDEWDYRGYDMGEEGSYGVCYRNLVLPENAIVFSSEADVRLVPSEILWTMDYLEHYY